LDLNFRRGKGDKDVKKPDNKTIAAFLDFSELIALEFIPLRITNSRSRKLKKSFILESGDQNASFSRNSKCSSEN
jgi:hypothetical protein